MANERIPVTMLCGYLGSGKTTLLNHVLNNRQGILEEEAEISARWDPVWGDRMTELVLIGMDMNKEEIAAQLDACLLSDEEMSADWCRLEDPFPQWVRADQMQTEIG